MPTLAPAILAARRDADARWPQRNRASDGLWGDARHQEACAKDPAKCEGHVAGNAIDLTHDPAGARGQLIASAATKDPRTAYVIFDRRIWSRRGGGWRPYDKHPHDSHVHISIRPEVRDDAGPWPWAPSMPWPPAFGPPPSGPSVDASGGGGATVLLVGALALALLARRR